MRNSSLPSRHTRARLHWTRKEEVRLSPRLHLRTGVEHLLGHGRCARCTPLHLRKGITHLPGHTSELCARPFTYVWAVTDREVSRVLGWQQRRKNNITTRSSLTRSVGRARRFHEVPGWRCVRFVVGFVGTFCSGSYEVAWESEFYGRVCRDRCSGPYELPMVCRDC